MPPEETLPLLSVALVDHLRLLAQQLEDNDQLARSVTTYVVPKIVQIESQIDVLNSQLATLKTQYADAVAARITRYNPWVPHYNIALKAAADALDIPTIVFEVLPYPGPEVLENDPHSGFIFENDGFHLKDLANQLDQKYGPQVQALESK